MRVALCYDLLRFCLCSSICVIDSRSRSPISYHFTPQHTIPPWSSTGTTKNCHHPRQGTSKFDSDHRRHDGYYSSYDVPSAFVHRNCLRETTINNKNLVILSTTAKIMKTSHSQSVSLLVQCSRVAVRDRVGVRKGLSINFQAYERRGEERRGDGCFVGPSSRLKEGEPASNRKDEYSLSDLIQGASQRLNAFQFSLSDLTSAGSSYSELLSLSVSGQDRHEGLVTSIANRISAIHNLYICLFV